MVFLAKYFRNLFLSILVAMGSFGSSKAIFAYEIPAFRSLDELDAWLTLLFQDLDHINKRSGSGEFIRFFSNLYDLGDPAKLSNLESEVDRLRTHLLQEAEKLSPLGSSFDSSSEEMKEKITKKIQQFYEFQTEVLERPSVERIIKRRAQILTKAERDLKRRFFENLFESLQLGLDPQAALNRTEMNLRKFYRSYFSGFEPNLFPKGFSETELNLLLEKKFKIWARHLTPNSLVETLKNRVSSFFDSEIQQGLLERNSGRQLESLSVAQTISLLKNLRHAALEIVFQIPNDTDPVVLKHYRDTYLDFLENLVKESPRLFDFDVPVFPKTHFQYLVTHQLAQQLPDEFHIFVAKYLEHSRPPAYSPSELHLMEQFLFQILESRYGQPEPCPFYDKERTLSALKRVLLAKEQGDVPAVYFKLADKVERMDLPRGVLIDIDDFLEKQIYIEEIAANANSFFSFRSRILSAARIRFLKAIAKKARKKNQFALVDLIQNRIRDIELEHFDSTLGKVSRNCRVVLTNLLHRLFLR